MILIILLLCATAGSVEIPKQIHVLFRHGERSPTSIFPNDPHKNYKWEGGLGHLTNRGKLQMYTLGQNIKEQYNAIFSKYYWPVDVNFTSSYLDRCLMSAELVGAGMFPPQGEQIWNPNLLWQPIPIHYLPRNLDNLLVMKTNCTEYDKQFLEAQNSSKVKQYNRDYHTLYVYLTEHTGKVIHTIEAVESLYDTLEIYQMNNLSLPYWVNDTLMDQMRIIGAQNLAIYSETDYMKKMKGGFFIKTVLNLMEAALTGSKEVPSINTYAGHDLTIVHVMRALSLVDTLKPEFGASLIFELYEDGKINVSYWDSWKGGIQSQVLPNCNSPCKINEFLKGYQKMLPVNWAEECNVESAT
ncbi:lysosomal acid phosphatase-like [Euwallacea similis]|uniref:lysosomal acid phosphatase-like n=1 Tax=Euwallacea similis TaxID=1736056 RepID=UPI00344B117F